MAKIITCIDCSEKKEHCAKGLCKPCYMRRWYVAHREERLAYQHRWQKENPDYLRRYRQEHREERAAYMRRYCEEHRERLLAYQRHWQKENREEYLAAVRRWQKENPEKIAANHARRYARKRNLPDTLTPEQAEHLVAIGQAMYPGEELHLDHIVPISKGGGTTRANMHAIPASLNWSKHDKLPRQAYRQLGLI